MGLYCAGWVKRGPVGIIDATLRDTMETFKQMKFHLDADILPARTTSIEEIKELFKDQERLVTRAGWTRIRAEEKRRGDALDKIKEKILDKGEMIGIATA